MPSIEVELQQLREVFQRLSLEAIDSVPATELLPAGGCKIKTARLILAFLDHALCPQAIAREILDSLENVGLNRIESTANSIIASIKTKPKFRVALVEWCYHWTMNFLVPMVEKPQETIGTQMHAKENALTSEVSGRDNNRCIVTGAYDTVTAPNGSHGPFATLTCARIMPTHIAENMTVRTLTRGFTGGRVDLDPEELDEQSNRLVLSDAIAGSFRLFQWSLRPERIQCGEAVSYEYFVEKICPRQVREILEHPSYLAVDIGAVGAQSLDPALCELHTAIGRVLESSGATAALLRYQREAPELGIYRIPVCASGGAGLAIGFEPLAELFGRTRVTEEDQEGRSGLN